MRDPESFWAESTHYTGPQPVTDDDVARVERMLGYRLPAAYVALLRIRNGGSPQREAFPTTTPTSWAEDHVAIQSINGIGGQWGIDADPLGSRFMIAEWGYPPIGIVFGQCPSAGHDAIMLDYRACGPEGEPAVVHVDVESRGGPIITPLARDFEAFVDGLVDVMVFEDSAHELELTSVLIERGALSPLLAQLCAAARAPFSVEAALRGVARELLSEKGVFALHADELSHLLYDLQFWLYSEQHPVGGRDEYLAVYPDMLVRGDGLATGGYAPAFVETWMDARLASGEIELRDERLRLSTDAAEALMRRLEAYAGE